MASRPVRRFLAAHGAGLSVRGLCLGTPLTRGLVLGHLGVSHRLTLGGLGEEAHLHRDLEHRARLLSRGDGGVTEAHQLLGGDGVRGGVLIRPLGQTLVELASLAHDRLAGLVELREHLVQHLGVLVLGEVGDGELEGGLASDGGLGHGDLPF